MSLRKTALAVFENCHPIKWQLSRGIIRSPEVEVDGKLYLVEVTSDRYFPLATVCPGGSFRCCNPWGWPTVLTEQQSRLRRLFARLPHNRDVKPR